MDHPQSAKLSRALEVTVRLDNNTNGKVIVPNGFDGINPRWKCNICCRTVISEKALWIHLEHPLHKNKLLLPTHPHSQFIEDESEKEEELEQNRFGGPDTKVLPGEPVPPGFEDSMDSVCHIQDQFDSYKEKPLIGLEYIVELLSVEEEAEPRYICLLCEKKGDPRSVMLHVTSINHYMKYIRCFFRTAGNILSLTPRTVNNRRGISMAILKVAEAIENHFGRLKPMPAEMETFLAKKYEILRKIDEKPHFRETSSTTFKELCTAEKIDEYSRLQEAEQMKNLIKPQSSTEEELREIADLHKRQRFDYKPINLKEEKPKLILKKSNTPPKKLSFTLKKAEKSLGTDKTSAIKASDSTQAQDSSKAKIEDDDVIILPDQKDEPIEINSLSSVSSSSISSKSSRSRSRSRKRANIRKSKDYRRSRSASRRRRYDRRSRSRDRYRYSRSPHYRARSPGRYRRRSHSRDRYRYYEERYRRTPPEVYLRRSIEREEDLIRREKMTEHYRKYIMDAKRHESPPAKKLKWEILNKDMEKLEAEMTEQLKTFQQKPESHPNYAEEWKLFWNRRYKEIQQSGQNPTRYDFKPEWIVFWDKRMKELHETELTKKKEELKEKFRKQEFEDSKRKHSDGLVDVSPPTPEGSRVTIDDLRNTWKALTGSDIKASTTPLQSSAKRSPSPWEDELKFPETVFSNSHKQMESIDQTSIEFHVAPPIIHCLRMLSVLEELTGSLAIKITELLPKALAHERSRNGSSMELLKNRDIFLFFEMVKEKLRAQLMAFNVPRRLVNATKNVLKNIEIMLNANPLKPEVFEPVQISGVGMVDKMAVAQQIASALITSGRTDVSEQELEELISAVMNMANASNANPSSLSTANFFSQLSISNSNASSHINSILSNMISNAQSSLGIEPTVPKVEQSSGQSLSELLSQFVKDQSLPRPEDDDLLKKIGNFTKLDSAEQVKVINQLKELETSDPKRAEELKKAFITNTPMTLMSKSQNIKSDDLKIMDTTPSFSSRTHMTNQDKGDISDDDDYSFEEVYHAATEKLKLSTKLANNKELDSAKIDDSTRTSMTNDNLQSSKDLVNLEATFKENPIQPPEFSKAGQNFFEMLLNSVKTISQNVPNKDLAINTPKLDLANNANQEVSFNVKNSHNIINQHEFDMFAPVTQSSSNPDAFSNRYPDFNNSQLRLHGFQDGNTFGLEPSSDNRDNFRHSENIGNVNRNVRSNNNNNNNNAMQNQINNRMNLFNQNNQRNKFW